MANKRLDKDLMVPSKNGKFAEGRLTRDEQLKVVQWCVELKSNYEIADLIQDEFQKTISQQAVWYFRNSKKWKPIINRLRQRFEKNILKIPIANKVDRLRILQKVIEEGLKWSLKTITKAGDKIYELKLGAVTEAVKAAKEEIEPHKQGKGDINLHGDKIFFQNFQTEGRPVEDIVQEFNNRYSAQFSR